MKKNEKNETPSVKVRELGVSKLGRVAGAATAVAAKVAVNSPSRSLN